MFDEMPSLIDPPPFIPFNAFPGHQPNTPGTTPAWLNADVPSLSPSWHHHHLSPSSSPWGIPPPGSPWPINTSPNTAASSPGPYTPFANDSPFGQPITAGFFGAPSSPMKRSVSHSQSPHKHALKRSASQGRTAWPPYDVYQGEMYNERNLARRPRDWRADYSPHSGVLSLIPKLTRNTSDIKEYTDVKRTLHPLLLYNAQNPPVLSDLRQNPMSPGAIEFPNLGRPYNNIDFAQLVTQPPANTLRLYHTRLPWYIDVQQSHPNGVTIYDIFAQMWSQLMTQISGRHYWNEELSDVDRAAIASSFQARCNGDTALVARGVSRIDFIGPKIVFEGLAKGKNGMWEIKTRKIG